ncbi:hypothetical protein MP228_000709 [Amoeboaphelidium protococcarum]|nr:hypothetical protein MP228_000709 [Amoeboaphelidium protococcarum]
MDLKLAHVLATATYMCMHGCHDPEQIETRHEESKQEYQDSAKLTEKQLKQRAVLHEIDVLSAYIFHSSRLTRLPYQQSVLAVAYVYRYSQNQYCLPQIANAPKHDITPLEAYICCFMIANKQLDDQNYTNKVWTQVVADYLNNLDYLIMDDLLYSLENMSKLKTLNHLERLLMKSLDYRLFFLRYELDCFVCDATSLMKAAPSQLGSKKLQFDQKLVSTTFHCLQEQNLVMLHSASRQHNFDKEKMPSSAVEMKLKALTLDASSNSCHSGSYKVAPI